MNSQPDQRRLGGALALLAAAALTALASPALAQAAEAVELKPYKARYQASYRGISGGQIENGLRRGPQPGQWLYETRAFPNLLGRVAVSPEARERSVMEVTAAGGVRPLEFDFNDGKGDSAKDVRFKFDWSAGRVRGDAQGEPFDLPVSPGTQDTASVQAAMIVELLAGRSPQGFTILTGRRLRDYRYWSEGRATVVTPVRPVRHGRLGQPARRLGPRRQGLARPGARLRARAGRAVPQGPARNAAQVGGPRAALRPPPHAFGSVTPFWPMYLPPRSR